MRIFVTGASGWIGSAVTAELLAAGHHVVGLARSDSAAATIAGLGAEVRRGSLDDLDSLRAGADDSEGVVHLGYNHDFSDMQGAAETDRRAITTLGDALAGTGRPLFIASGVAGLSRDGTPATEDEPGDPASHPRVANAAAALAYADRGVRAGVIRFAPTVHGDGDHGFIAVLVDAARRHGVSAYVGDGSGAWPAVHRADAATLVRLAIEQAPAAAVLHAVAEPGVSTKAIAEAIGRGLDLPVKSVPAQEAPAHFGWIGMFFGLNMPASSEYTQRQYGWTPTHPTLLEDLDAGYYTRS
ncbi:SDR family oxidoreductase [Dactylosporangium vinaceum]|uniref:SDR family oxidoreductase n=1 Tax=Dactylosporangium vinaceum TaxID=53362 RepID=A0ABV5LZD8_9ACTN|nr:SDR family oxidoreductase [Dactylosporangium vinaceum]UAB92571.1 SDR family oxidoreductase [Dactylosporangium vinaceum]